MAALTSVRSFACELIQVYHGFRGQDDLVPHSGEILARLCD